MELDGIYDFAKILLNVRFHQKYANEAILRYWGDETKRGEKSV